MATQLDMLARAPRTGARLGTTAQGSSRMVWVSSVIWGGEKYTRVESSGKQTKHYLGILSEYDAAKKFSSGKGALEDGKN